MNRTFRSGDVFILFLGRCPWLILSAPVALVLRANSPIYISPDIGLGSSTDKLFRAESPYYCSISSNGLLSWFVVSSSEWYTA
jgi:hypothetical protein